jgi:3-phenylpropionate/trans-cinnamate dioxygenase ferredoxin reductase component
MSARSVTIVGAGLAGIRTAQDLRRRGHEARITLLGSELHLPYDRPPLSKAVMTGEAKFDEICLADERQLNDLSIDYRPGSIAVGLSPDRAVLRVIDGSELPFEQLIIATGATPRQLPFATEMRNVYTLRTIEDSLRIREATKNSRRVCVVGGGVLGSEIAASLRHDGLDVTIVEMAPTLAARVLGQSAVATELLELHRDAGIHVRLNTGVLGLTGGAEVAGVKLTHGTTIPADLVIAALGVRPDTDWLDGSGLHVEDGLVCDRYMRTSRSNIWGAGDVVRIVDRVSGTSERAEHWTNAVEQADVVAQNVLVGGDDRIAFRPAPYVWSDQHGERIQTIGYSGDPDVEEVLHHPEHPRRLISIFGSKGRFRGAAAIGMPRPIARLRALLAQDSDFAEALALARSLT